MKLRYLTLALGLAGLMSACDQMPMNSKDSGTPAVAAAVKDDSAVVAEVNGSPITRAMLDLYMKQRQNHQSGEDAGEQEMNLLNEVINLELARQRGEKAGLDRKLEVALQIEQQRRAVIASAAIQQEMQDNPITDEELRKIYDENVSTGDEYKARHILVAEKAEAEKLIAELDKGADFSELAKQHSTGPSGKSGGELGWFSARQMVKPFSDAVATMEKGSYTKQPVQTEFGWHVIMLDDSRQSTPPDFEMLKPQIMAMVQNQRVQEYIADLREGATINITAEAAGGQAAEDAATEDAATEDAATDTAPAPAAAE